MDKKELEMYVDIAESALKRINNSFNMSLLFEILLLEINKNYIKYSEECYNLENLYEANKPQIDFKIENGIAFNVSSESFDGDCRDLLSRIDFLKKIRKNLYNIHRDLYLISEIIEEKEINKYLEELDKVNTFERLQHIDKQILNELKCKPVAYKPR